MYTITYRKRASRRFCSAAKIYAGHFFCPGLETL
nr:MAG TPA: hypothetical protein [Caudoviricetes sp.]